MWIYYYCSYGPGHQSTDYGFEYFHENFTEEDIRNHLLDRYYDWHDPVVHFWEIKKPPVSHVNRRIEKTKEKIKGLKGYLKVLEAVECFSPEEVTEKDTVIQNNLKGIVVLDLLMRLHRSGFMYSANDISLWRSGISCPVEPTRTKILRIIRRTKKYPSHK